MGEAARRAAWAHLSGGSPPWQAGNPATLLAQRDTARRGARSTSCARAPSLSLSTGIHQTSQGSKPGRRLQIPSVRVLASIYGSARRWWACGFFFFSHSKGGSTSRLLSKRSQRSAHAQALLRPWRLRSGRLNAWQLRPLSSSHTTREALLVVLPLTLSSSHTTREALLVVLPLTVRALCPSHACARRAGATCTRL